MFMEDHRKKPRAKRSPIWKISDEELRTVVENSKMISEILGHFQLKNKGCNYRTLYKRLDHSKISINHIPRGLNSNRKRPVGGQKQIPLEEVLVENSTYSRGILKKRLIKEGLLEKKCYVCKCDDEWLGKPLTLVIDHINGKSDDNRLENLRLLCPNCNSQTETFCGRNRRVVLKS